MYNKNGMSPRTDPWGMPQFIAARPDSYPFIDICDLKTNHLKLNEFHSDSIESHSDSVSLKSHSNIEFSHSLHQIGAIGWASLGLSH